MSNDSKSTESKKQRDPLGPGLMQPMGLGRHNFWDVTVPAGTTVEEILDPGYWAHNAHRFNQFDTIRVCEASGAYVRDLLVLACSRTSATVTPMSGGYVRENAVTEHRGHVVEFAAERGWRVVRKSDKQTIYEKAQTPEQALDWLKAHLGEGVKKAA